MKPSTSLTALALAAALGGCTATPLDYHSYSEIPKGPGMFSGKEGAFVLEAKGSPKAAATPAMTDEEYREFQDWREWRRAREEAGKK